MRHAGGNLDSRARRFYCMSRHKATPRHFLFELNADGSDYTVLPTADEINDWLPYRDLLQEMVGRLVGFPVELYWASSGFTGVGKELSYQVMPTVEEEHTHLIFWWWHLDHNRQFFLTPLEAGAAFVRAWRRWAREMKPRRKSP